MKAVSNAYGKIREILLIVPMRDETSVFEPSNLPERFGRMFEAFADRVSFVVIGNFPFGEKLREGQPVSGLIPRKEKMPPAPKLKGHLIDFSYYPAHDAAKDDNFSSLWAQDPFCVLNDGRQPILLEPFEFRHRANQLIVEHLSDSLGYMQLSTRYYLEGGNILIGDDYMLVGRNTFEKNRLVFCPNASKEDSAVILENEFRNLFGVDHVYWVGCEQKVEYKTKLNPGVQALQPLFHLDLFVTLAGPSNDKHGRELVFVAEVRDEEIQGFEGNDRLDFEVLRDRLNEVEQQIKSISREVHGPEFEVARLPLGLKRSKQGLLIFSLNNCLVEVYRNVRKIYLPKYPKPEDHDEESDECRCYQCISDSRLRAREFKVIEVDGSFEHYAPGQGSLHCMTKVLKRENNSI